jgi:hypothetical protein
MNEKLRKSRQTTFIIAYLFAAIILGGYIVIYRYVPFTDRWNDIVLNLLTVFSAAVGAIVASLIFRSYEKDDSPRLIWQYLMIGCWLWFTGEVIWAYFASTVGDVPVGAADWAWTTGFICFNISLYYQYSVILPSKKVFYRNISIAIWIVVLLIPLIIVYLSGTPDLRIYIDYFYPFADLAVGIAGVLLVFTFRGGALTRPWLGLVIFGITDFLYAWAEQTGIYVWSAGQGNLLSLIIDSSYLAAYLILALGFLSHWVLLRYGIPESSATNG